MGRYGWNSADYGESSSGKRGKWSDDHRRKCGQCRKWEEEGQYDGRTFYCSRCWAKWEQQSHGEDFHQGAVDTTGEDAHFLSSYKAKWKSLIELEWSEEMRVVEDRLQNWSLDRLVKQGFCITDLSARRRGEFFGKAKVTFSKDCIPRHQFTSGDEVLVSRRHPLNEKGAWKGELIELSSSSVTIVSDSVPPDVRTGSWRLDCGANKTAYERTKSALGFITGAKFKEKKMRRLILNEASSELRELESGDPLILPQALATLNTSQVAAINGVHNKTLGLIQGPPGTGKTTTTCHMIKALVDRHRTRESCGILVAADSNVAVDQLLEGLVKLGVNALRMGFPSRVAEGMREHTLLAKSENHPLASKMEETREAIRNIKDDLYNGRLKGKGKGLAHRDISMSVRDLQQMEQKMVAELIDSADVVCSTLIGCGADALLQCRFPTVIIDEASQATEPRCLVAIQKCTRQLILVGDQQQLPPVVVSDEASSNGLSISLFDRLLGSSLFERKIHMLTVQYRMHPMIRKWPSSQFYNDELQDGPECISNRAFNAFPKPVTYVDTSFSVGERLLEATPARMPYTLKLQNAESQYSDGSKYNLHEVQLVVWALDVVLQTLKPEDIGIISPYTAQISEIKRELEKVGAQRHSSAYQRVEVKTVDGYQGREKEVIILSCVRTKNLGFLVDYRRLNVAITRAKRGLIIIGCSELLRQDDTWRSYLNFIEKEGMALRA
eukprot:TRINITY_DN18040_c0_g3_i1.p1 TRINITY_DN18040_c0_g3~~TRINITY_DN18040_c0_g3_i1.p1  ORF type:complete len:724 (+),score=90.03 TRINITY_DN18040_c0_g3_i1:90-2261(+)